MEAGLTQVEGQTVDHGNQASLRAPEFHNVQVNDITWGESQSVTGVANKSQTRNVPDSNVYFVGEEKENNASVARFQCPLHGTWAENSLKSCLESVQPIFEVGKSKHRFGFL